MKLICRPGDTISLVFGSRKVVCTGEVSPQCLHLQPSPLRHQGRS
jgi:hypothetical protein